MNPKLNELGRIVRNPGWLCRVWFGMTAGISLLETQVRFLAPTLTRPVALDVGRVVFEANNAEWVALTRLLPFAVLAGKMRTLWGYCTALAALVVIQSAWLLPVLSARSELIVAGIDPKPSLADGGYATTELLELALFPATGFRSLMTHPAEERVAS